MPVAGSGRKVVDEARSRPPDVYVALSPQLAIHATEIGMKDVLAREREDLSRQERRRRDGRRGLPFVLVRGEVVKLVPDDGASERAAHLLVRIRQDSAGHGVGGVQLVVAKIAEHGAADVVRTCLADRLYLHAGGAPLGDVEQLRHELELRDRLAAELRLTVAGLAQLLRDLLAIEIELEQLVAPHARRCRHIVSRHALHEHRQRHPVPPLERQLLHLTPVDVADDLG